MQTKTAIILACLLTVAGCAAQRVSTPKLPAAEKSATRLLLIGQDLDAIRSYRDSGCCPAIDGATTYVSLYNVLSEPLTWGGLGLDARGRPTRAVADWGSGPVNAYTTALESSGDYLAIGLSIAENWHPGALNHLLVGVYDRHIDRLALFAGRVDKRILLRIGYEFDGHWNGGYGNAPKFQQAWRYIVDRLRAQGVDNIEFVWQSATSPIDIVLDGGQPEDLLAWYPGDEYVDWLGLSWFLNPDEALDSGRDFEVATQRELANDVVRLARDLGKPVLIAEAAPQAYDLRDLTTSNHAAIWDGPAGSERNEIPPDEIWARWYQPLFDYLQENRDVIRGLAYINVRWDDQDLWDAPYQSGYWGDSRLEANADIAQRFSTAIEQWRQID